MAQGLGVSVLRTRTFTLLRSRCSVAQPYRLLAPLVLSSASTADCQASGISGSARSAPLSACVGALLLLLADIIARTFSRPMS